MPAFVFVSVFHASVLLLIMNFVVKRKNQKTKPKPFKLRIELIEKTEEGHTCCSEFDINS